MEITLTQQSWEVKGFWPWVPVKGTSMEIGNELLGVTEWIPAAVPGGVHGDLFRAGLIDDPYRGLNSLHCEWVENRWWAYRTVFAKPEMTGKRIELVCKGLDYEAMVIMNGTLLGEHKGMFHPCIFDVTELLAEARQVEITIVFKQAPDEMGQIGKTSETYTQKSRFNYKWDFSTRLVNVGIWDDVVLRVHQECSLANIAVRTDGDTTTGTVAVSAVVDRVDPNYEGVPRLRATVLDPEGTVIAEWDGEADDDGAVAAEMTIPEPKLWYPNGYGPQPIYTVSLALVDGDRLLDERTLKAGIRRLEYAANEGAPEDALPYTMVVNGRKIYIKGANITPLDHLYGNVGKERYDWQIGRAKALNLNLLRVWGGGIIEKPYFYELCDRHGIMVWQEFTQSSSGIDNIPSKQPEFLALLRETALAAIRERRNHVSLAFWSGGNELMSRHDRPSTFEDENLAMLKALVEEHDPGRLFLPTSGSGPVEYITEHKGVSHDVHGHWKYQGNPEHYELYRQSDSLFHSEFGVDGMSAEKSLVKFLNARDLKVTNVLENPVWRHHGEWWDTYDRESEMFGKLDSLADFIDASQWMQAEGLRFILEANRRRKFANSGSIVWQLNEPWPNVTCTNLMDYYGELKMAAYWVKNAFQPRHACLDYRKLNYRTNEAFRMPVYVFLGEDERIHPAYTVYAELLDEKGRAHGKWRFAGKAEDCHKAVWAGDLNGRVPAESHGVFFIRLTLETEGAGKAAEPNLYVFSVAEDALYAPAFQLHGAELKVSALDDWQPGGGVGGKAAEDAVCAGGKKVIRSFHMTNTGSAAALHVYPQERTGRYWLEADRAYFTLFPGESATVRVTCAERAFGPFEELDLEMLSVKEPQLAFYRFGCRSVGVEPVERTEPLVRR